MARTARKRRRRGKKPTGEMLSASVELMSPTRLRQLADEIDLLNDRDKEIQSRLGAINAEAARLSAEQAGIAIKRLQKLREIDAAANG
jgi:hypothetical protein